MALITFYVENLNNELIQHNATDKIQLVENGKGTGMFAECQVLINDTRYNPSNLIPKTIELAEGKKVIKWVENAGNIDPVIVDENWLYEENHIRMLIIEEEALKKKSGALADLASDMITRKVPYEVDVVIEGVRYLRPYFKFLEKDDEFEINAQTGKIENNDSKFKNVIIEQFGTFSETIDYIIQDEI